MQKQGSVCIARLCVIVSSIAKRCQCHQPANKRDQGINFQGKRYPLLCKNSVCRSGKDCMKKPPVRNVQQHSCLTNYLQAWTVCPHCSQECESKFNWDGFKELPYSHTVFSAKSSQSENHQSACSLGSCTQHWALCLLHYFWFQCKQRHVGCWKHWLQRAGVELPPLARPWRRWGTPAFSAWSLSYFSL